MRKAALLLLPLLITATMAFAQQGAGRKIPRVPVVIALVDHTPGREVASVVLRRVHTTPHDVILLHADSANAQLLSNAVLDLLAIRGARGDTASEDVVVRVTSKSLHTGQVRRRLPWTQRFINDLHDAEKRVVAGVGVVQAVQIWLPPRKRQS
jgi:hypothetical protein